MSGETNQGPIMPFDIRALLDNERANAAADLNVCQVGTIVAVNLAVGTVQVLLVLQRAVFNQPPDGSSPAPNPTYVPYPTLVDVPLYIPSGGTAVLTMPVAVGDTCIVLFNDRDLDPWWTNGTAGQIPNDLSRVHSLADGIAFVGIRSKVNAVANWDAAKAQLRNGTSYISVGPTGGKLGLGNSATTLKLVLDNLASVLQGWVDTHGDTPNPATLAAIAAFKTLSDSLLE